MHIIVNDFRINNPELESYINKLPRSHCRVTNSRHRGIYYDLMLMGLGCIFVTDMIATIERHRSDNVLFVPIDNKRTLHAVYKKGRTMNEEENAFISVLSNIFAQEKNELF